MARGVFTSVVANSDLSVSGSTQTDSINIGSNGVGCLDSAGSVSVQFTTTADVTLAPVVQSDEDVPQIVLDTTSFETIPSGTFSAGDHIVQLSLPVVSLLAVQFSGTATVSNIRINIQ